MPFLSTSLDVRTCVSAPDDIRIWQTLTHLDYFSPRLGKRLRAMIGTLSDGVSDPKLVQPFLSKTGRAFWPSIIHDAGYEGTLEIMNDDGSWGVAVLSKEDKDEVLREACLSVGFSQIEADAIYEAVAKAGMNAFVDDLSKPIPHVS